MTHNSYSQKYGRALALTNDRVTYIRLWSREAELIAVYLGMCPKAYLCKDWTADDEPDEIINKEEYDIRQKMSAGPGQEFRYYSGTLRISISLSELRRQGRLDTTIKIGFVKGTI